MRFVIFSIFSVLWVVMWWWTYTCHIKLVCCPEYAEHMEEAALVRDADEDRPLLFRWSEASPIITPAFDGLRDSLLAMVGEHESLQVTGFAFRDEGTASGDLGEARARAIAALLSTDDSIDIVTRGETASLSGDVRDRLFEAATFEVIYSGPEIPEIPSHLTFRFDPGTAQVVLDTSITTYIQDLVERLRYTRERVQLTGHSDNVGSAEDNQRLALERASLVGQLLEEAGVPAARIDVYSKGEEAPEASNATAQGRQQNRRVELQIIEPQ